jgi:hypothetical protein
VCVQREMIKADPEGQQYGHNLKHPERMRVSCVKSPTRGKHEREVLREIYALPQLQPCAGSEHTRLCTTGKYRQAAERVITLVLGRT